MREKVKRTISVTATVRPVVVDKRCYAMRSVLFLLLLLSFVCSVPPLFAADSSEESGDSISKQRRQLDYFYLEALKLKNQKAYDAAYDLFEYCLSIDSTASFVLYELSSYYLQREQGERAVTYLRRAVVNSPENFYYRFALASSYYSLGMYGEAAEEYELLVRSNPEKVELNYYLAEALTQKGDIGKAIDSFDELEEILGISEALSLQKFKLYMDIERPKEAFHELIRLTEKYPENARYQIMVGDLYLERNETEKAYAYYQRAHQIDPENPYYTVSMSSYYEKMGDRQAAEEQIRAALINEQLEVETKIVILTRYINQLLQSGHQLENANALFKTLIEQHPEDVDIKMMYASLLLLQQNLTEARFQYALVTEMMPDNEVAWQQLLKVTLQLEAYDQAVEVCKRCQLLFPESVEYTFYLGITLFQQANYSEALEVFYQGVKEVKEEQGMIRSNFYGQIGDTYFQMRQKDDAFAAYEEALKINGENIVVLNNYSYYLSLEKRELDKAERMSAQCVKLDPDNSTYLDTYAWIFFVKGNYTLAKIYIEKALSKDTTQNPELYDHYGDILFQVGEQEKAVEQWKKAVELGKGDALLQKKIEEKSYYEE